MMKKAILFGTVLVAVTTLVAVPKTRKVFVQYLNDFKYYYNSQEKELSEVFISDDEQSTTDIRGRHA